MTNALSVRALTKKFGDKTAVDALDLDIRAGELYIFTHPEMRDEVDERFAAIDAAFRRSRA